MGCCRTTSSVVLLILGTVMCFPEESFLKRRVANNSSFAMQKSMANNSEVYVKLYCKQDYELSVSWIFLQSPCIEAFLDVNATRLLENVQLSMANSDKISFKKGSSRIKCSSLHPYFVEGSDDTYYLHDAKSFKRLRSSSSPPGLLTTVWESGAHLLVLKVDCLKEKCSMDVDVEIELRNPDGSYLSAVEFPFLPVSFSFHTPVCFSCLSSFGT
ncbi:hypothetical protein AHF37_07783 [Paragonimus kellicotti]|nr:hypothetical protein AHF37_07783 [Paragonimus kellicotti]